MYKIYVCGYFVGVETLTPAEVHRLNNDIVRKADNGKGLLFYSVHYCKYLDNH